MPLCTDPSQTFPAVLDSDKDKPEADRPTFHFHYMSARKFQHSCELADMPQDELKAKYGEVGLVDKLFDTLCDTLDRVVNAESEDLKDYLTVGEAWELFFKSRRQGRLSVTEKNESGSQSPLPGDESALDASPAESAASP